MGVRTNNRVKLHSELFSFKEQNYPFQKYVNWIKTIKNHNNGYYDPDFLFGLFDSLLCSKIKNSLNSKVSNQKTEATEILVICPDMEILNPFISILINEINSDKYRMNYGVQDFWEMAGDYDIIHIHWPELFFNWRIPVENDIKNLSETFHKWKQKGTKIIYTRHDEDFHYSPNKLMTQKTFDLVKKESDAIVHLGEYSKRETMKELNITKQINVVIPHHIYDTIYCNNIDKETARSILDIDKNSMVILTFGYFRDREEHILVKEAFEQLDADNKFLLAPSWKNHEIIPNGNVFLGDDISTALKALDKAVTRIKSRKEANNEKFVRENWNTSQIVEQYRSLYQTIASK